MSSEYEEEALDSMFDEAMDLVEKSEGDVLVCESGRGLMLIIENSAMSMDLIAEIKQSLKVTWQ